MKQEVYDSLVDKIQNMSSEEYNEILEESREMDEDFRQQLKDVSFSDVSEDFQ